MGILSQQEVDALIQSLVEQVGGEGEVETAQEPQKGRFLRVYDFRSPDKFAREQIRILYMLHDDFARLATLSLSAHLRAPVSVNVVSVEQSNYEEFLKGVTDPTVLSIFSLPPLRGKSIMEFDLKLGLTIIDRLFGGGGGGPGSLRALTEIEKAVLKTLFAGLMEDLCTAWRGTIELKPAIDTVDSDAFHAQFLSSKDVTVTISLQVTLGDYKAGMKLCLPYYSLEPVLPRLSASHWISRGSREDTGERVPEKLAREIPVRVAAELGSARVTLRELVDLEPGDVIRLGNTCESPVRIMVEGRPKFIGQPGRRGQRFALRIVQDLEEAGVEVG